MKPIHRGLALLLTAAIFIVIFGRIPFPRLVSALQQADYALFFSAMIPNTIFYFCWDTLVLTVAVRWFHGPARYRDLLPARAASYVVGFFNTNAGRGALAAYLARRLHSPFLQLGSTVLFLVLSEYLHLVAWATVGILQMTSGVARELLWGPPAVALLWILVFMYARVGHSSVADRSARTQRSVFVRSVLAPRDWAVFRTFRLAPARRYAEIMLLRAPMFLVSLTLHYVAARAFGLTIPFVALVAFLPVIFMIAALPITVAHLGTTQAAWIFFFGAYGEPSQLLAFSLAAHLTFTATRAAMGIALLPWAYGELVSPRQLAVD
jgi:uncharacterized membrane protein YbhN (UPF0104 family)